MVFKIFSLSSIFMVIVQKCRTKTEKKRNMNHRLYLAVSVSFSSEAASINHNTSVLIRHPANIHYVQISHPPKRLQNI